MGVAVTAAAVTAAGAAYAADTSAKAQKSASSKAAALSQGGTDQSIELQKQMFDTQQANTATARYVGDSALMRLWNNQNSYLKDNSGLLHDNSGIIRDFTANDFSADPGYQFRLQQGQQALDRAAAAGGRLYSGRALKDTSAYNSGQAAQEYSAAYSRFNTDQAKRYDAANYADTTNYNAANYARDNAWNKLSGLAGIGQNANAQSNAAASNYGTNLTGLIMNNAGTQGNAALASGNAAAGSYAGYGGAAGLFANALGSYYKGNNSGSGNGVGYYGTAGNYSLGAGGRSWPN